MTWAEVSGAEVVGAEVGSGAEVSVNRSTGTSHVQRKRLKMYGRVPFQCYPLPSPVMGDRGCKRLVHYSTNFGCGVT